MGSATATRIYLSPVYLEHKIHPVAHLLQLRLQMAPPLPHRVQVAKPYLLIAGRATVLVKKEFANWKASIFLIGIQYTQKQLKHASFRSFVLPKANP